MKFENYQFPKSSFLSLEKDTNLIINQMLKNERLKKLLFYNTNNALECANLNQTQTLELLQNNIKVIPKIKIDPNISTHIVITFDNFIPSSNPEFRDNDIIFDIVCGYDTWQLQNYQQRPFKIAGELDYMFNNQRLTGIGTLQFVTANLQLLNENYCVLTLIYHTVHGGEDSQNIVNPKEAADFIDNFNNLYNN